MSRWKCVCSYDGTDFAGWQTQPTLDAVQDTVERALEKILKEKVRIQGSGRTDAGVHALGQVFHFDAHWAHDTEKFRAAIHSRLPESIRIESVEAVEDDFHARYSANGKRYHFRIHLGQADPFDARYSLSLFCGLDLDAIRLAGQVLLGEHDFSAFSADNGSDDGENPVKDFRHFEIIEEGSEIRMIFEASGFMYKMVRSLVGALIRVGRGVLSPEEFKQILESGVRTKDVVTAAPQGLFLEKVYY